MVEFRDPVIVPPRRSLTRAQRAKLFDQHRGVCCICGFKIHVGEPWIDEHDNPREISADDSLSNRAPAHEHCAKLKTKQDVKTIAKVKRIRARHLGIKSGGRAIPGSKRSRFKRKMDGTVVDRATGEPIGRKQCR